MVSSAAEQLLPIHLSYRQILRPGANVVYSFSRHSHIIMFPKAALSFLAIYSVFVNGLAIPVARSPTPVFKGELPVGLFLPRSDFRLLRQRN